jgi:allantoicase
VPIVPKSSLAGDTRNLFPVDDQRRFTHVRLTIHPDGGVARLRVHGAVVPDPVLLPEVFDVAALAYGGRVTGCSDMFYGHPQNMLMPGLAQHMGDGWETSRRRDDRNDWVIVELAAPAEISLVDLDTSHFKGNAPGTASVRGADGDDWFDLLPPTPLRPDTPHRFPVRPGRVATQVRLDIFPDGGMARLRMHGRPVPGFLEDKFRRHAGGR